MLSLDWFTLARIGLLYDLLGALILVWGFASQGKQEFSEANAFYKEEELKKVVATKLDSIVGLSFIVIGFFGQLAGSDNAVSTAFLSSQGYVIFALIFLVGVGGTYLFLRKLVFQRYLFYIEKDKSGAQFVENWIRCVPIAKIEYLKPGIHAPRSRIVLV